MSTLTTCTVEGCKRYAHAKGRCQRHYDEERRFQAAEAAAAGEAKAPQARGGRRDKYPPSRTRYLNTNGFRKGESGNPFGCSSSTLEIYRMSSEYTADLLPELYRVARDPATKARDLALVMTVLDRIRMNSAQLVFGPNGTPATVELLAADGGVVTPLTKLAANNKGDYESLLAERNRINAELRRIDQERDAERDAKEDAIAAARTAKARGEEIHPAMALLLKVRDDE